MTFSAGGALDDGINLTTSTNSNRTWQNSGWSRTPMPQKAPGAGWSIP